MDTFTVVPLIGLQIVFKTNQPGIYYNPFQLKYTSICLKFVKTMIFQGHCRLEIDSDIRKLMRNSLSEGNSYYITKCFLGHNEVVAKHTMQL